MKPLFAQLIASSVLVASSAEAAALAESSCSIVAAKGTEKPAVHEAPGLKVLDRRPDDPPVISGAEGVTINAILCIRSEAMFAENDDQIPRAGFPLFVKTDSQTAVLEINNGQFRVRTLSGPQWSEAQQSEIQRLLDLYQNRLQENAHGPPDRPHAIVPDKMYAYEKALAPYVAQARKTYPDAKRRFLKGLPADQIFYVTTRLRDADGHWEQAFVRVHSIRKGVIRGQIASDLTLVKGYRLNQDYSFGEDEVFDWLIAHKDGSEEGNVVGKFLDTYPP